MHIHILTKVAMAAQEDIFEVWENQRLDQEKVRAGGRPGQGAGQQHGRPEILRLGSLMRRAGARATFATTSQGLSQTGRGMKAGPH